jgi:hypothetical protein
VYSRHVAEIIELPRGGTYIRTSAGVFQVGIPAETIKDSLALGLPVPEYFVLPQSMFDRARGRSMAEFEFPSYYNFFLLKRRVKLLAASASVEARARDVFQESLFGPKDPPSSCEFDPEVPLDARPHFLKESEFFRQTPGRQKLLIDDLVDFHVLSPSFTLGDVRVEHDNGAFRFYESGELIADVARGAESERARVSVFPPRHSFVPPDFGVTVLGASHGFDPEGKTTGFMIWIGGRALLVDPPIDTTDYLRERGVSPKLIDGVILTHCHADHDSGTFQKLLEEGRTSLFTTPHILGSFLRKYASLSDRSEDELRRLFDFYPVCIGRALHLRGGELRFKYRLHSIPTIGVEAYYGGKSLSISADTLYDPERIEAMYAQGVFGEARRNELIQFPSHHTLVLHEAGVPPLHTPAAQLRLLPEDVRARLKLVHIAAKDVPEGLLGAPVGLEKTIVLDVEPPRFKDAISRLETLTMVDFLRELPLSRARALLSVTESLSFAAGDRIVEQGARGELFYVIARGVVSVRKGEKVMRRFVAGDFFGETALILDQPRVADVVAETDVDVLAIPRDEFLTLLRGSVSLERLRRLAQSRSEGAWLVLDHNSVLRRLTSAQKTQFEALCIRETLAAGEMLIRAGAVPAAAYLLDTATVAVDGLVGAPFSRGAFLGEIDAIVRARESTMSATVVQGGHVFRFDAAVLRTFFQANPGAELAFVGTRFVE